MSMKRDDFLEDMLNICSENSLPCNFLLRNREEKLFQTIKDMYIPNNIEQFNDYLDPFCMMIVYDNYKQYPMFQHENYLISHSVENQVNACWDIKLTIRTICQVNSRSVVVSSHLDYGDPQRIDIDEEDPMEIIQSEHIISTIKEIMTVRLLKSLQVSLQSLRLSRKTLKATDTVKQVPLVGALQEFMYSTFGGDCRITRAQCYFESDSYYLQLKLQDPPLTCWGEIFSLQVRFGSFNYIPHFHIGTRGFKLEPSVYEKAKTLALTFSRGYPNEYFLSLCSVVASWYLSSVGESRNFIESTLSIWEYAEERTITRSIHPIAPLFLVFTLKDMSSISAIQLMIQKCCGHKEAIEKIKSILPIQTLIEPIFNRIVGFDKLHSLWEMKKSSCTTKKYGIKKYLKRLNKYMPSISKIVYDASSVDLQSWSYPTTCDFSILNKIFKHVTSCILFSKYHCVKPNPHDNNLFGDLCFNIEHNTEQLADEWNVLLKDEEKLVICLEETTQNIPEELHLESLDIKMDERFSNHFQRALITLREKIVGLKNSVKSLELVKIIKHITFWSISLEFLFLSILFIHKNKTSNDHLYMFLVWMKEIKLVLKSILAIFEKLFRKITPEGPIFQDMVMEDVFDRKISIEEVRSLIQELCVFASLRADRIIVPVVSNLYISLCRYIGHYSESGNAKY